MKQKYKTIYSVENNKTEIIKHLEYIKKIKNKPIWKSKNNEIDLFLKEIQNNKENNKYLYCVEIEHYNKNGFIYLFNNIKIIV